MPSLNITRTEEIPALSSDGTAPGVIDAVEIRSMLDAADEAFAALDSITDPATADAVRSLAHGLNSAGVLFVALSAAIHRGNIAVSNYPDAL